jgi:mono/diheme cytochrome c family protein
MRRPTTSRRGWLGGALLALIVVGCATMEQIAPPVDALAASRPELDGPALERLQAGRALYVTECARCHRPEWVTNYTRDEWSTIMPRMVAETKLGPDDRRAVEAYVEAVLAAAEAAPPAE